MAPSNQAIVVGMRMRPLVGHEQGQLPCMSIADNKIDIIYANLYKEDQDQYAGEGPFSFDVVMDSSNSEDPSFVGNDKCYQYMGRPLVETVLEGYNACLFCYGQTGTGKTATVMGYESLGPGLLPRMLGDMCDEADKMKAAGCTVTLTVQMLEVYNESINDLLLDRDSWGDVSIKTRVMPTGVVITGATSRTVETLDECIKIVDEGTERKTVAATKMNPVSSRGHTVFKLAMDKFGGPDATKLHCEVYFADLAGHENIKTTEVKGQRLTELTHINSSLMYLQRAISDLAKTSGGKRKGGKVNMSPFRNSELTLLLANGIVGNSKSTVIVTLSPAAQHFDTSYSSIEFGTEVKGIKLEVTSTVTLDPKAMVKKLQAEVQDLKTQLAAAQQNVPAALSAAGPGGGGGSSKDEDDSGKLAKMVAENARLLRDLTKARQDLTSLSGKANASLESQSKASDMEKKVGQLVAENGHLVTEISELREELAKAGPGSISKDHRKKAPRKSVLGPSTEEEDGPKAADAVEELTAGGGGCGGLRVDEGAAGIAADVEDRTTPAAHDEVSKKKKKRKSVAVALENMRKQLTNELLNLLDSVGQKDNEEKAGHAADLAGDGVLGPLQFKPFMVLCGFEGSVEEYSKEWDAICTTYNCDSAKGMSFESFLLLVDDENSIGYCSDRDLVSMIAVLKRTDKQDADNVQVLALNHKNNFAKKGDDSLRKPTKQVTFDAGSSLQNDIEDLNRMNMELANMVERLQTELEQMKTKNRQLAHQRPPQKSQGFLAGICGKRKQTEEKAREGTPPQKVPPPQQKGPDQETQQLKDPGAIV